MTAEAKKADVPSEVPAPLAALAACGACVVVGDDAGAPGLSKSALDVLVGFGYAQREVIANDFVCPGCGGADLEVVERCSRCSSVDVDYTTLIHHLECAGVFPDVGSGGPARVCPKCGDPYLPESRSFERCGLLHHCNSCGADRPESSVQFKCRGCQRESAAADTPKRKSFRYTVSVQGEAALKELAG